MRTDARRLRHGPQQSAELGAGRGVAVFPGLEVGVLETEAQQERLSAVNLPVDHGGLTGRRRGQHLPRRDCAGPWTDEREVEGYAERFAFEHVRSVDGLVGEVGGAVGPDGGLFLVGNPVPGAADAAAFGVFDAEEFFEDGHGLSVGVEPGGAIGDDGAAVADETCDVSCGVFGEQFHIEEQEKLVAAQQVIRDLILVEYVQFSECAEE